MKKVIAVALLSLAASAGSLRAAEVDASSRIDAVTVFPMGAIHFEANMGCEPAVFVAGLNDEDPGVLQIAQRCASRLALSPIALKPFSLWFTP